MWKDSRCVCTKGEKRHGGASPDSAWMLLQNCFLRRWFGPKMVTDRGSHSQRVWKCCWRPWLKGLSPGSTGTASGRTGSVDGPCPSNTLRKLTMIWPIICQGFIGAINGKESECISATWRGCGRSGRGDRGKRVKCDVFCLCK